MEMAKESLIAELEMNHRVKERSPNACAEYIGHCEVAAGEAGRVYDGRLEEGLWLVWRFQGTSTLHDLLKQKNGFERLLEEMELETEEKGLRTEDIELVVARWVTQSILSNCAEMHRERLVHRDIKPENCLVVPGGVRLLDLGACVDLKDGTNYDPKICVRDPLYCPPELEVIPEEAVEGWNAKDKMDKKMGKMDSLWQSYQPGSFDVYCVGVVLMQIGVKSLRATKNARGGIKPFNNDLVNCDHDLDKWRASKNFPDSDFSVLDANQGAGWELAKLLLQKASWNGGNDELDGGRPSAETALQHRFFTMK